MSEQIAEEELLRKTPNKDTNTCERCSHYQVCFTRLNIENFLEQHFPSGSPVGNRNKPFNSSELAKICRFNDPQMRIMVER